MTDPTAPRIVLIAMIVLLTYGFDIETRPLRIRLHTWRNGLAITGGVVVCLLAQLL